jgi:hypothetical protein
VLFSQSCEELKRGKENLHLFFTLHSSSVIKNKISFVQVSISSWKRTIIIFAKRFPCPIKSLASSFNRITHHMTSANGFLLIVALNSSLVPLDSCSVKMCSLQHGEVQYNPSLAANVTHAALSATILTAHFVLGISYRTRGFLVGVARGLVLEMVGYAARARLLGGPLDFNTFFM